MCSYAPRMGIESHISKAPAADKLANEIAKTLEETKNNLKKPRITWRSKQIGNILRHQHTLLETSSDCQWTISACHVHQRSYLSTGLAPIKSQK